jgi:hypothetical protein
MNHTAVVRRFAFRDALLFLFFEIIEFIDSWRILAKHECVNLINIRQIDIQSSIAFDLFSITSALINPIFMLV